MELRWPFIETLASNTLTFAIMNGSVKNKKENYPWVKAVRVGIPKSSIPNSKPKLQGKKRNAYSKTCSDKIFDSITRK